MNKRVKRALEPGLRLFFFVLIVFAGATLYFNIILGVAELLVVSLLYLFYRRINIRRRREILRQIDTISAHVDVAAKDSAVNFPLPLIIVRLDNGGIVWSNDQFHEISGGHEHLFETHVTHVIPDFTMNWLLEGKSRCPSEVKLRGRVYNVYGTMTRTNMGGRALLGTFYWIDVTETITLRQEKTARTPVVSIITMDNYDECMQGCNDSQKSQILAAVDERINRHLSPACGVLRKYDRDRFLVVFERQYLDNLLNVKPSLLDSVREVVNPQGHPATISVGICKEAESLQEQFTGALLAIDMALSRGGDQIVVKNLASFDFYGGRTKEFEKRTKVKSRVTANALVRLIGDSSRLMIMGHRNSDLDSVGAAVGMFAMARKLGKPAHLVINTERTAANVLIERLRMLPEYKDAFIDAQEALLLSDRDTLLVIADVSKPDIVEFPELLQSLQRIVVIDHHRRGASYIENASLSFHEPYASSASELVCELIQYVLQQGDLKRIEAEALLSGIVLDTKNFQMHTGARTFEAAAWLRGAGADTMQIKLMFQEELPQLVTRGELVRSAMMLRPHVAVAAVSYEVDRVIAAQVADELLDVKGVQASFVLFMSEYEQEVIVSARSLGDINVQVICEKLGGGGHQTIAGAQVKGELLGDVLQRLAGVINTYCDENSID